MCEYCWEVLRRCSSRCCGVAAGNVHVLCDVAVQQPPGLWLLSCHLWSLSSPASARPKRLAAQDRISWHGAHTVGHAERKPPSRHATFHLTFAPPIIPHPCQSQLKANFLGTEYMLWGRTPDKSVRKGYAAEKLCINFKQTALNTTGGPRAMYVVLPMPDSGWQPTEVNGKDSLSNSLELARHKELPPYLERKMAMMCTKPPEFDESIKGVGGEVLGGEVWVGGREGGSDGDAGTGLLWWQALRCSLRV